jgi:TPP-dependent pyruvate/acetoin dehydrogenase alpha subunit
VLCEAIRRVREERCPLLVEAVTYRFRGHSMADPEQYRTKEEVSRWRERDPIASFGGRLLAEGVLEGDEIERIDADAIARVDAAVEFAEASPFPSPESLYDNVYVLEGALHGSYSTETVEDRATQRAEAPAEQATDDEVPQQLTEALATGEDASDAGGHGER